jgi:hypothetical protein
MIAPDPLRSSDTTQELGQNSVGLRAKLPLAAGPASLADRRWEPLVPPEAALGVS